MLLRVLFEKRVRLGIQKRTQALAAQIAWIMAALMVSTMVLLKMFLQGVRL